jgi:ligand-binding sensor protein
MRRTAADCRTCSDAASCVSVFCHRSSAPETIMRFLQISGPGVANDEAFCPYCQVMLEDQEGYKVCRLCHYDTRQSAGQQRIRVRRR